MTPSNSSSRLQASFVFAFALAFGVAACSGGGGGTGADEEDVKAKAKGAQMNDLTLVYPLAKTQAEFDTGYLSAASDGNGGALLPQSIYEDALGKDAPVKLGADTKMRYANLRVVGMRLDPCFANIGPVTASTTCDNQLRLIFQSLTLNGDSVSAIDGAIHAFYELSRDELTTAINEMIALRVKSAHASDLGPLDAHPLLVKQGLSGDFGTGLSKIILSHAGAKNLIRFTTFASQNLQTTWLFEGFDINAGKNTPMDIPTLPSHNNAVTFFAGFALPISGGFTPETTSKDDVAILVNIASASKASAADRQAAYDAALRIENPNFHSPNTIDCASCHAAQAGRTLIGEDKFMLQADGNTNAFVHDSQVSAADAKATTKTEGQAGLNVHMMSYKGSALMIGQRVINETASVVSLVNTTILKSK